MGSKVVVIIYCIENTFMVIRASQRSSSLKAFSTLDLAISTEHVLKSGISRKCLRRFVIYDSR